MKQKLTILYLFAISFYSIQSQAQVYGNEWINYSQSYFKFKIYKDDIYRIPISSLTSIGLPSTVLGDNLQLFRDGVEVPIYVSSHTTLGGADYIEFYGEKANGTVDAPLYKNPSDQINLSQNSISDTAYYFITFNASTNNKRFTLKTFSLTNPPAKESYFLDKIRTNYRNVFGGGESYSDPSEYSTSSQYENGEGYAKSFNYNKDSISFTCLFPYTVSGAPNAFFKTAVIGNSYLTTHRLQLHANSNLFADSTFSRFGSKKFNASLPMSYLNAQNKLVIRYSPLNTDVPNNLYDRIGICYTELRYPRQFNFNNVDSMYFELDPKLSDYYLEIANFKHNNVPPRLYDLTSNEYLIGDLSMTGFTRFLITASTSNQVKRLVLQSQAPIASVGNVIELKPITFKNFSLVANQGDYLIVSNNKLFDDGNGHNYVEDYKNYRSSTSGGSYSAIVADVNDLYNEFGYGYVYHAQALKNFFHYAVSNSSWITKPKFAFLIGKGIKYSEYLNYSNNYPSTYQFPVVPAFGVPCSDNLLSDFGMSSKPQLAIGRLPIIKTSDIKLYLDKVIGFEQQQAITSNQISDSVLWRKNVLHIAGAKDANQQAPILSSLNAQQVIISDTSFGGNVTTIKKSTTAEVESANSELIDKLFKDGLGFVQFFGHGSSGTLDYNFDHPEVLFSNNRYPIFLANGCSVGDMYILTENKTLGERFTFAPNAGSIAFVASNNTGYTSTLADYTDALYGEFTYRNYGKSIGEQVRDNVVNLRNNYPSDGLLRQHAEQINIDGDPAVRMSTSPKPDYAIEDKGVIFDQQSLTTNMDSFDLKVAIFNLGKYTKDSISLLVKRTLPNGVDNIILSKRYGGLAYSDTVTLKVAVQGNIAIGDNKIQVTLDNEGFIDEMSETNNSVSRVFSIYNDDLVPVYPYEFSIVGSQGVTLKGSTLNPFSTAKTYIFQIDTTEKFDSPLFATTSITDKGGVIKWQPPITLRDSTVYYWRTAMDTTNNGVHNFRWSASSFIYLDQSSTGWNQSHYFQFKKDNYRDIYIDSSRKFEFVGVNKKLQVTNVCLHGPAPFSYDWPDYFVSLNGSQLYAYGCDPYPLFASLQFVIIDTLRGQPWINTRPNPSVAGGRFGSFDPCREGPTTAHEDPFFEFSFLKSAERKLIMDFIDSIPSGYFIMMQPRVSVGPTSGIKKDTTFIKHWKADTLLFGANNSLYHKLKNIGFNRIDSFYKLRPMIFWERKNDLASVQQYVGADSSIKLYAEFNYNSYQYEGTISTNKIGPAKVWGSFSRRGNSVDNSPGDSVSVNIYGIDLNKNETLLATVLGDTSLSFIKANVYPSIRLEINNKDNIFHTPEQLKNWRVLYQQVPEAALSPNRYFVFQDTIGQGFTSKMEVAIENLTELPMDSMLVKYDVIDANNNKTALGTRRYSILPAFDTIHTKFDINSSILSGRNKFVIEANPSNDQLEEFHPNNIGIKDFYVIPDKKNPVLDVTFDGVHILDKDIVSSKPFISISLKDENKYLALDDTSLVTVLMRYHGESPSSETRIPFDGTILKFIPANAADLKNKNIARIEYRPEFLVDGDDYQLIVRAKDKSGNNSGSNAYKVGFEIVNKPSISSVVNYPNPFTTSTQFVFTITGYEVPTNLKIQIISPTGKIVREIIKSELGNLHIGTNITEFKWKGDDQYGQMLGNGVYLYRVVSNLHGEQMDHYKRSETQNADKWIEKGFGKLYIMR